MVFVSLCTSVLDFWEFYGAEKIRDYLYKTAKDAGKRVTSYGRRKWFEMLLGELLVRSWGTQLLADSSFFGAMVVVALPEGKLYGGL